ncbi:LysR family transcriptional regulator [Catenuloplanes indicus]|uniref:DNA-binding transcriptional LysR family regulator n=1 Tax=Catenuloplanes indicus TaxID=137267 RepID=A0AAE4AUZ6_9ACTN|nr:LysR family transcriptional regulator [Catenuloplanes indicus]MDQ0364335.1 DNA-binding transcriptional LysR family regulator [Catenuloplanes indicus]
MAYLNVHPQLLQALRTVLDTGSLTAAAERLGFTQSALSKQIATLETAAGTPLVRRGPRGVEPTEAGTRLAARAATILDQLDAARRELDDAAAPLDGRLALGGFPATAMELVPRAIARLRADHPSIRVGFLESSTLVQIRRLRAGRLDLALIAVGEGLPEYDLTGIELDRLPAGRLLVAVGRRHRLARADRVTVDDLAGEDWVAGRGGRSEPQFGAWPTLTGARVVAELGGWAARLGFVAAGLGIMTVPSLAAGILPADVVAIEVDDPAWTGRTLSLARIGALTPAGAAVRSALITEASAIAARSRPGPADQHRR